MANEITAVNTVVNRQVSATDSTRTAVVGSSLPIPTLGNTPENANPVARRIGGDRASRNEPDSEAVNQAVQNLNDHVQSIDRNLEFTVDRLSGNTVISVIDPETEEVIRQIPPETAVNAAKNLQRLEGLLLSAEA